MEKRDIDEPTSTDETTSTTTHTQPNNDVVNKNDRPVSLIKLLSLARPEMGLLSVALLFMIVSEAVQLINPILLAGAYDALVDFDLSTAERMANINNVMVLVVIIHFSGTALSFLRSAIMAVSGERVVARTRNQLYANILRQEMSFFDATPSGELVSRLSSDAALLQQGTSQALPEVILGAIKVVVCVVIMFWISAKLAAVMVACVFTIVGIVFPLGSILGQLTKVYQDILGEAQTYSTEALGAMRTVQSFAAEKREETRYKASIGDPDDSFCWFPKSAQRKSTYMYGFRVSVTTSAMYTVIFGLGFGSLYFTLWYGFKLVNDGELTLGELTAFQSYIFSIGGALGQASQFITKLIQAQGAAARIFYLLERTPSIPAPPLIADGKEAMTTADEEDPAPTVRPASMEGNVSFDNVSFSYPTRSNVEVLKNFSLSIPANQTAALVGASGSGKSTVVSLLQRFYDVSSGTISIDGNDIRNLDLQWMRSHIACVQQEPQLFGLSIRENIVYGVDRDVTQEELEDVARKANAHDFVSQWPDGYDTLVGERGVQLSGGQKQRIAICRALLINPRLLLLDEATSALDAESEHLVQEAIEKAVVGRTVLIIAHRLSTIQRAGQIVVLSDSGVVDGGTHEELLSRCSTYQDLIKRQSILTGVPPPVEAVVSSQDIQ